MTTIFDELAVPILAITADFYDASEKGRALTEKHGIGYFIRANLVRLAPGGTIEEYRDGNFSLTHSHRIPEGEIYEINNRRLHSVHNAGAAARIHLILDYVLKGEKCCCGEKHRLSLPLLLLGFVAVRGVAQADDGGNLQERLLACEGIVSQEQKLERFNAVVDGLDKSKPQAAQPSKPQQQPAVAPAAAVLKDTTVPVEQAPVVEAVTAEPDSDYGLRPKKKEKPKEAVVMASIVRVWMNHDQRFSVELDNGQRWRETQGSRVGKPKEGALVTVSSGSFGGFRMKIDGISRKARVRRTK